MTTKKSSKKTTSRRSFVTTVEGEKLELTKSRLSQIVPEDKDLSYDIECFAKFSDIRKATVGCKGVEGVLVHWLDAPKTVGFKVEFVPERGIMGCCEFDEKNFNKIMKAAGSYIRFGQPVAPDISFQ